MPHTNGNVLPTHGLGYQQTLTPRPGNHLNPAVPHFRPTGTEMQRYHPAEPTPPTTPRDGSSVGEMQRFIADTHIVHTQDIIYAQNHARRNHEEINAVKATVAKDLQTLQSQIQLLRAQVVQVQSIQRSGDSIDTSVSIFEPPGPQTEEMLQRFEPESIAAVYREQAQLYEETAARLRRDADNICRISRMSEEPKPTPKLLEDAFIEVNGSPLIEIGSGDVTPTHVPPRHASRAVEIKTPLEPGESLLVEGDKPLKSKDADAVATPSDGKEATLATASEVKWQPLVVRQMPQSPVTNNITNTESFSWEFLKTNLGGEQWSPGFYFISRESILPSKAYWVLDAEWEPFLPSAPGQHGAKLTAFFNSTLSDSGEAPDEENYKDTPLFISQDGGKNYTYFGNYSQLRYSDKLDYDRVMETVPEKIRQYWADQLAAEGRPGWVTEELRQHFWPKPAYDGPLPTDSALNTPATAATMATDASTVLEKRVTTALAEYVQELKDWEKEVKMKVRMLKPETLMEAFKKPDADLEPGLRLWWEYLQCVGYDKEFYDLLVQLKSLRAGKKAAKPTPKARPAPAQGKGVSTASGIDTVQPTAAGLTSTSQTALPYKGSENFERGSKPWETPPKAAEPIGDVSTGQTNRDLDAAKQMAKDFKTGGQKHSKNSGSGKGKAKRDAYAAPHLRGGKA